MQHFTSGLRLLSRLLPGCSRVCENSSRIPGSSSSRMNYRLSVSIQHLPFSPVWCSWLLSLSVHSLNSRHILKLTAWPSHQSKGELRSLKNCLEKRPHIIIATMLGSLLKSLFLYMRNLLWLQIIHSLVLVLRMKAWTITLWLNTLQAYVLREIFTFCIL